MLFSQFRIPVRSLCASIAIDTQWYAKINSHWFCLLIWRWNSSFRTQIYHLSLSTVQEKGSQWITLTISQSGSPPAQIVWVVSACRLHVHSIGTRKSSMYNVEENSHIQCYKMRIKIKKLLNDGNWYGKSIALCKTKRKHWSSKVFSPTFWLPSLISNEKNLSWSKRFAD